MATIKFGDRVRLLTKAAVGVFSEDSAKAAYGLLAGIFPGAVGPPPVRGTREYLQSYSQMPWLRAVCSRVAWKVSSTEWKLYTTTRPSEKRAYRNRVIQRAPSLKRRQLLKSLVDGKEAKEVTEHPVLDLLHNANEFHTAGQALKVTQLHLDLVGEAFWLKERATSGPLAGQVTAFWPVPPDWVAQLPTPTHRFFRVNFRAWRGLIPDTEFVWFSDVDPWNPYTRGSGTAQALSDELETDEYTSKHTKAFFYNRARPDIIVSPKGGGNLTDPNLKRLEEDWNARTQGFWKAFKPYFVSREVEIKELDQNFRSLQLVQLRQFERDAVMQTFGVPPEILGVLENSNRATIDAADHLFCRYVIEPRLEFMRGILQERLIPEYDDRFILDFVSPVQEDRTFKLQAATAAPFVPTLAQWRELMEIDKPEAEPEESDDLHWLPNTGKWGKAEEPEVPPALAPFAGGAPNGPPPEVTDEDPPAPPAVGPKPPQQLPAPQQQPKPPAQADEGKGWAASPRALLETAAVLRAAGDAEAATVVARAAVDDGDDLPEPSRAAAALERPLARALVQAWAQARAAVEMNVLEQAAVVHSVELLARVLEAADGDARQTAALEPALAEAFRRGAEVGAAPLRAAGVTVKADPEGPGLAVSFGDLNPEVLAWAQAHAAALVAGSQALRETVRALVVEAQRVGMAPAQLARLLRDVVGLTAQQQAAVQRFEAALAADGVTGDKLAARVARYAEAQRRRRALTIARTETIAATNAGQQALWRQAVAAGLLDAGAMKQIWIVTWDERLESACEAMADETAPIGQPFSGGTMAPPLHPNCRCALGLVRA